MSFIFQLIREDEGMPPAVVFEDSTSPGLVPLWEEVGVYDALYNSDGRLARDVSRAIAYGLDRVSEEAVLARLMPPGLSQGEAVRFLENVNRACVTHGAAWIQTR
ncbi:hypothetical protein [Massilia consociata]|uniref:Uncharacterized protein n=1 Tax=Massilia consociata TaxID=760117 RepID=A0ABV6FCU9_9BURK